MRKKLSLAAALLPAPRLLFLDEPIDVVLANIGADVLIELAPELEARGKVLVLSGLLVERADEVASAYAGTATVSTLEGWAALTVTA
jgi:ABC-2 type transport system ATP-binding protein